MGIENSVLVITQLINFWQDQRINIISANTAEIEDVERTLNFELPYDFKELYLRANGMRDFYPNEIDEEGFLIYPVEAIVSVDIEFAHCNLVNKDRIFIFAEYMHKSWWYGLELKSKKEYAIGILVDNSSFRVITNSLVEFIELYMKDSIKLYPSYY